MIELSLFKKKKEMLHVMMMRTGIQFEGQVAEDFQISFCAVAF